MEIRHHGHDPDAPAWYMSMWFVLLLILVIALLTIWFTFARNTGGEEEQVQAPPETTALPLAQAAPSVGVNSRQVVWALRIQRGWVWEDRGSTPAPPVTLS